MITIYSGRHKLHAPRFEICDGVVVENFEKPSRAEIVLKAVTERISGEIIGPEDFPEDAFATVHSRRYIEFLKTAGNRWATEGGKGDAMAYAFNTLHPEAREPKTIHGLLGMYTSDGAVPITPTSWEAIETSARVALTGAKLVAEGVGTAFSLCRPPGHHAARETAAGYCFLNNAAIAAQYLLDQGAARAAILDIDFHHGNGTQDIFYERDDVLFASIHIDPSHDYPYFLGHADEKGRGKGEGYNFNYPLQPGSGFEKYEPALEDAVQRIGACKADFLLVSLGVDTFEKDPISTFRLKSEDYLKIGGLIATAGLPTLFVMEGGYAVEEIGINVANVLEGFKGG